MSHFLRWFALPPGTDRLFLWAMFTSLSLSLAVEVGKLVQAPMWALVVLFFAACCLFSLALVQLLIVQRQSDSAPNVLTESDDDGSNLVELDVTRLAAAFKPEILARMEEEVNDQLMTNLRELGLAPGAQGWFHATTSVPLSKRQSRELSASMDEMRASLRIQWIKHRFAHTSAHHPRNQLI